MARRRPGYPWAWLAASTCAFRSSSLAMALASTRLSTACAHPGTAQCGAAQCGAVQRGARVGRVCQRRCPWVCVCACVWVSLLLPLQRWQHLTRLTRLPHVTSFVPCPVRQRLPRSDRPGALGPPHPSHRSRRSRPPPCALPAYVAVCLQCLTLKRGGGGGGGKWRRRRRRRKVRRRRRRNVYSKQTQEEEEAKKGLTHSKRAVVLDLR